MYAVVKTGAKQYRVTKGDHIKVEKLPGNVGDEIRLNEVLMIGGVSDVKIGTPLVTGAVVTAKILEQDKSKKVLVYKVKRRKSHRKKIGHRQAFTRIEITGIETKGA